MKLSFLTLGCPNWDLDTICARGRAYGFDGVDLRGYLGELDVTRLPEFSTAADGTRRRLADAGLEVNAISTSIQACSSAARQANLEEARRTIASGQALGAGLVRIFGGGSLETHSRAELARIGCGMIEEILALDGAAEFKWLFETHDLWIKSQDCRLLLESIPNPNFGALWDMGHTLRVGAESARQSLAALGRRIGYCHIKDAVFDPAHPQAMTEHLESGPLTGWRYVLPGTGQLPLEAALRLLKASGYSGWLACEHEKRWHPQLPEPEILFPAFTRWARNILNP